MALICHQRWATEYALSDPQSHVKSVRWWMCVCFSHERVLECISEQAEEQEIERFQPLLSGMHKNSITLKVKHSHGTLLNTGCWRHVISLVCVCVCRPAVCSWSMLSSVEWRSWTSGSTWDQSSRDWDSKTCWRSKHTKNSHAVEYCSS